MTPFANEPITELRRPAARAALLAGLDDLALPVRVPVWIGDDRRSGEDFHSPDPGTPDRLVAVAAAAGPADVDAAVAAAHRAQPAWAAAGAETRANALLAAAAWMRERRPQLAALAVRECAKPWSEADADVCEAIDFLEYYARGAVALENGPELLQMPGERNTMRHAPRGVCAVIAPWNFPLAIPTGMAAAALATGNAVVLKPAEQAPGCGLRVAEALRAGGVPPDVLALLPGAGETGAALAAHPQVQTIAFTGSQAVGRELARSVAEVPPGGRDLKRLVAELGGKNCVIVDSDADLDEAVPAIVASAYAYAGQKCSAASRVLVAETLHDTLAERLAGAVAALRSGDAADLATDVPALIEPSAAERVAGYAEQATRSGRVLHHGEPAAGFGHGPVLVADLDPGAPILHEEIFGPLLSLERVASVDEACERVAALPVALTGGLFSRNPRTVRRVIDRSPVGNLYVNRAITGAMVGRQPFGGNRLSGTGTKAGGPGYLEQFTQSLVVCENTERHGIVV